MDRLLFHIISGGLGIFIASKLVPNVFFAGNFWNLLTIAVVLGLVNFFIRPILKMITLPLTILTLGLFSFLINMLLVWIVADILFPAVLEISGIIALFWTTLIIWLLNIIFGLYHKKTAESH